jgi:lipopolysaccharide export system protein LptA
MKIINLPQLLLCIACLALPLQSQARKSDFSKAINVQATSSEFDEKTGMQTLRGDVVISQGSMVIKADEIMVSIDFGKLSMIKGTGSPIHFEQENEEGELISGQCLEIIYDAKKASLILIGNAFLKQPNQELKGERIEFDSKNQKVHADGGQKGRVTIKIQPPTELTQ